MESTSSCVQVEQERTRQTDKHWQTETKTYTYNVDTRSNRDLCVERRNRQHGKRRRDLHYCFWLSQISWTSSSWKLVHVRDTNVDLHNSSIADRYFLTSFSSIADFLASSSFSVIYTIDALAVERTTTEMDLRNRHQASKKTEDFAFSFQNS